MTRKRILTATTERQHKFMHEKNIPHYHRGNLKH